MIFFYLLGKKQSKRKIGIGILIPLLHKKPGVFYAVFYNNF